MKLSYRILINLIDGKGRTFKEITDDVYPSMDPVMAHRAFIRGKGKKTNSGLTLEEQVEVGNRKRMIETLHHLMESAEIETTHTHDENWLEFDLIKITDKGKQVMSDLIFSKQKNDIKQHIKDLFDQEKLKFVSCENGDGK